MRNLFKMYLYKIRRTKATYILLIALFGMTLFVRGINKLAEVLMEKWDEVQEYVDDADVEETETLNVSAGSAAVMIDAPQDDEEGSMADSFIEQLKGGICLLFIVIYLGILFGADDRQGFMKNIAVQVPKRSNIVFARLAATAVIVAFYFAASFVLEILMDLIFAPGIKMGFCVDTLITLGIEFLLHLAFCSLVLLLITWWRNAGLYMPISILLASGFHSLFAMLINTLITAANGDLTFDVGRLFTVSEMQMLPVHDGGSVWVFASVLAIVYLFIWNALNILIIRKKDIA